MPPLSGRATAASNGIPAEAMERLGIGREQLTQNLRDYFSDSIPGGAGMYWPVYAAVKGGGVTWLECTLNQHVRYGPMQLPLLLVSSHCSSQWGTTDYGEIRQGGPPGADNPIGYEAYDKSFNNSSMRCPSTMQCKWSDAALMSWCCTYRGPHYGYIATTTMRGGATVVVGTARLEINSYYEDEDGENSEPLFPFEGDVIDRIGAVTGWQYGEVVLNCIAGSESWQGLPVPSGSPRGRARLWR
jgi:hypothetical protein